MMRLSYALALSTSLCAGLAAQDPVDAAKKTPPAAATPQGDAASQWKALEQLMMERTKDLKRGDKEGRAAVIATRKTDLEGFVKQFATAPESVKAHLELAQIAAMNQDQDAAKTQLAAIDVKQLDMQTAVRAAMLAKNLDAADSQKLFVDNAIAKAKTVDERLELTVALRRGLKDETAADALMKEIETAATNDEDKATVAMHKATMARMAARDDKKAWADALADIVKSFPATKAGKVANGKLLAAQMGPGTDPVPFTVKDMDGKDVAPADYKGKVLLIDFWATWCGPCMQELPHVRATYEKFHDKGFEILGISLDRDTGRDALVSTIAKEKMNWRHVYDGKYWQAEIAQLYDVTSIPFTVLVGKDGKVIGTSLRGDALGEAVETALSAK